MSFLEKIFGSAPAQQATQQQATNTIQSAPTVTATSGNGTVPNNEVTNTPQETGLDLFKDFWVAPTGGNKEQQNMFNVDPAKLQAAVSKADFTKSVSPDLLKKVAAGGDEAVAALQQVLNGVAGNAFTQQTMSNTKIMEQAMKAHQEKILSMIPDMIKQQTVTESLKADNPIFSHPAAEPMLNMIQSQMQQKFPNATAADIKSKSMEYLTSFAEGLAAPAKQQKQQEVAASTEDWSKFLGQ